jgi:hypothetical protein
MKNLSILILFLLLIPGCKEKRTLTKIPVIYSTDLFHPPMDPDDHFDLACLFALNEIDLKAIIIDNNSAGQSRPGFIPIEQMETITGKNVPIAIGLKDPLKSSDDDGSGQLSSREGVELILKTLEESEIPVTLITVGSLRDATAAYNAKPGLFREKVFRIFIFAGDASVTDPKIFREYNVGLDTLAFERIMNSGLDIYWIPCFDGGLFVNRGQASYLLSKREELFRYASERLMNYFGYALTGSADSMYIKALDKPADTASINTITFRQEHGSRNLWCSHVFPFIAGRKYIVTDNDCKAVNSIESPDLKNEVTPFTFNEKFLITDSEGMVRPGSGPDAHRINLFSIKDSAAFTTRMTSVVAHLLGEADREASR